MLHTVKVAIKGVHVATIRGKTIGFCLSTISELYSHFDKSLISLSGWPDLERAFSSIK